MPSSVSNDIFYRAYDRQGEGTVLKRKHIRQFTKDFVEASGFIPSMSVLELGCGNGLFLRFLQHLGVTDFIGVDGDPRIMKEISPDLAARVQITDFADFFAQLPRGETFERVVMFDVLEHFSPEDGVDLLHQIRRRLAPKGRVVLRTPNMASPWGMSVQYNDFTHRAGYTAGSLRQVAKAAGLRVVTVRPQAYNSRYRELREGVLTGVMSWFLSCPPQIWSPNLIGVLETDSAV